MEAPLNTRGRRKMVRGFDTSLHLSGYYSSARSKTIRENFYSVNSKAVVVFENIGFGIYSFPA
jgi:hypothetical protein